MGISFHLFHWNYLSVRILVQDRPLLAAPCRWDHHLCTDLKQEGKMMENAMGRTHSRQVRNIFGCTYLCVGFGVWINLSIRDRGRKRERERAREIQVEIGIFSFVLAVIVSDLEADGACWRTTRTGFQCFLTNEMMCLDVTECIFSDHSVFSCFFHPQWIVHCSTVDALIIRPRLLQEHDVIQEQFSDVTLLPPFPMKLPFSWCASWFQDRPLLAAQCRWDHHPCTDLKQEGKMQWDRRCDKYVKWLHVSLCWEFTMFTVLGEMQGDWLIWSFSFAIEQRVKAKVNYLSIRNRKRRRRERERESERD